MKKCKKVKCLGKERKSKLKKIKVNLLVRSRNKLRLVIKIFLKIIIMTRVISEEINIMNKESMIKNILHRENKEIYKIIWIKNKLRMIKLNKTIIT